MNNYLLRRDIDFPKADWFEEDMSLDGSFISHINGITGVFTSSNIVNDESEYFPYRRGESFISPNRNLLVYIRSGFSFDDSEGAGIEIWNTDTWRKIYTLKPDTVISNDFMGNFDVEFNSENSMMAIAFYGQVMIWDIQSIVNP